MDHGMEEERRVNRQLIEFSKKLNLPLVATNDVHYLKKEHAKAHEIMLCIQTQSLLSDPRHFRFPAPEFYFKSPEEMEKAGAITGVALQRRFHAVLYLTVSPIFTDEYTGKRGDMLLVERDAKELEDGTIRRVYEDRKQGDTFVILDPRLRLENLGEVQQQVVALLSGTKTLGEVAQEEEAAEPAAEAPADEEPQSEAK